MAIAGWLRRFPQADTKANTASSGLFAPVFVGLCCTVWGCFWESLIWFRGEGSYNNQYNL